MEINVNKTKTLHVRNQDAVSKTTNEEVNDVSVLSLVHIYTAVISSSTQKSLTRIHASRYKWKNEFKVQKITTHQYD